MQLVSIETLLVLGMLTLPAMPASLPVSQASSGHLLHRRVVEPAKRTVIGQSIDSLIQAHDAAKANHEFGTGPSFNMSVPSMRTRNTGVRNQNDNKYGYTTPTGAEQPNPVLFPGTSPELLLGPGSSPIPGPPSAFHGDDDLNAQPSWVDQFLHDNPSPTAYPIAAHNYHFTPKVKKQLPIGVLRRPDEALFYREFKSAVADAKGRWFSVNRKLKLMEICDKALKAIQKERSIPIEYDISFARFLIYIVRLHAHVDDSVLLNRLKEIEHATIDNLNGLFFPWDLAEAIAETILVNQPNFEEQKAVFYGFLRDYIFGYAIEPTDESDKLFHDLALNKVSDRAGAVIRMVDELGFDYHSGRYRDAIENIRDETEILSKL